MASELNGNHVLSKMFHRSVRYSFFGFFTVMLNTAVDGVIIGHFLGAAAMSAFGLIVPLYSFINIVVVLLRTVAQLNIGEDLGHGKLETARRRVFQLLFTGLAAALVFILLFTVFRSFSVALLCPFSAHSENTIKMAEDYLFWMAPSMIPVMMTPVLHPVMQLDGDARRSPLAIYIATTVNILGDILNVMLFHGGMAGIAAATTISCYVELLVLLLHYARKTSQLKPSPCLRLRMEWLKALSKGIPVMLHEMTVFLVGIAINHLAFMLAGEDLVAAVAAGNSVFALLLPGSLAVSGAVMTLGSVARGEADHKGVRSMLRMGLWYALLPCSIYAIVFMISAVPLARFFHGENERLMNMTAAIIRGYAFSFPLVAICQIIESYLNVIGKRWLSAIVSMLEGGIAWIVFSWLLRQAEPAGRIWLGHLIGEFSLVFAIAVVILFCRNLNRQKELLTDRENDTVELETTVYTFGEASVFSESVRKSCLNHGISSRISMLSALCVEEAACNTLRWGFSEETDCAVDIRAVCRNGEIIIRFRDSGRRFNPKSYISQVLVYDKNPAGNIGLRIISNIMSEMQYMCIMDCNILLIHIR